MGATIMYQSRIYTRDVHDGNDYSIFAMLRCDGWELMPVQSSFSLRYDNYWSAMITYTQYVALHSNLRYLAVQSVTFVRNLVESLSTFKLRSASTTLRYIRVDY